MAAKLELQIITNASNAVAGFKKVDQAAASTGSKVQTAGGKLGGILKGAAAGLAIGKMVEFGKTSVKAAEESAVAHNRLVSVFKGVGDVNGQAAAQAEKYASALSKTTGIDDEVIMGAQAILATFHSVSGATGRQAGMFDRATAAAADLAAAGFGSIESNAVALGKALEDPTKGMTALAKSGVTFTDAQKDQIKNMQKSGNLLGAQKIVLAAVEGQVKGTAAATATSSAKMKVAWGNAQESIGSALIPAIAKITPVLVKLFGFIERNSGWLIPLIMGAATLAGALLVMGKAISVVSSAIKIGTTVIKALKIAWMLLNAAFAASPIGVIIVAIVALIAGLVLLYLKVDWFRKAVDAALRAIVGFFLACWNGIKAGFNAMIGFIQRWGKIFLIVMLGPWYFVFKLIQAAITGGWSGVVRQISGWVGTIARLVGGITNAIAGPFIAAWGWINQYLFAPIYNAFRGLAGWISGAMSGVAQAIARPFEIAWGWIQGFVINPLKSVWNAIAGAINAIHISVKVPDWVPAIGGKGWDWRPPHVPTLAQGGLLTASGLVYAHAGEVITPAPAAASRGPAVNIEHAHFSERIDIDVLMKKVAWQMQVQRI
jgi:hypothetical protein